MFVPRVKHCYKLVITIKAGLIGRVGLKAKLQNAVLHNIAIWGHFQRNQLIFYMYWEDQTKIQIESYQSFDEKIILVLNYR